MPAHHFTGKWITDEEFASLAPRNVFHRQLEPIHLPADPHQNRHILFRKTFTLDNLPEKAQIFISADDYYKLYCNGQFVDQGPAPAYHFRYNYNVIDLTPYLRSGKNVLAVHTYYQGLINRVWVSGDFRHGMILDLIADQQCILSSDESFLTHRHTGYTAVGTAGYSTQFMERYDSRSPECDFFAVDFDDSAWQSAREREHIDYTLTEQESRMLVFEEIAPVEISRQGNLLRLDFGKTYVGTLSARAKGLGGERVLIRMGQELNPDGSVRNALRSNCLYNEEWILSGGEDILRQFDYKAFRYAEIEAENGGEITDITLSARHCPFTPIRSLRKEYADSELARQIWELCVHSLQYGVQETIQDCPDREKGFYLGDGCYSAFAHYLLSGDDAMVRKLIDDAFASSFITAGLVTCMDCSMMQEIAEYPLILADLLLWHYRLSGDMEYLRRNFAEMRKVLEHYRAAYEQDGLLCNLDRWCVVEWPKNYQDGYAVDIAEGKVCTEPHISINAYYYRAVCVMNTVADILGEAPYRDECELSRAIFRAFYDTERHLFADGTEHRHISLIGNAFAYAFNLFPDEDFAPAFLAFYREKGEDQTSFFTTFPLLLKFARENNREAIDRILFHPGTWKRMLSEGATSTYEGWGRDCKWNTSLFHLTMSAAVIFMTDDDLSRIVQ